MTGITKSMVFDVKAVDGSLGRFSGIASTYGNVDQVGDVMVKGCFTKSIATKGTHYPLLWEHDMKDVIGSFDVTSTEEALIIEGKFNMDVQRGREGYALLKAGDIQGLSIGFSIVDCDWDPSGLRLIKEADLWEVSLVAFPCNLEAMAEAKNMDLMKKMKTYDELDDETKATLRKLIKDALADIENEEGETPSEEETSEEETKAEDEPAGQPEDESENESDEDEEGEIKAIRDIVAEVRSLKELLI